MLNYPLLITSKIQVKIIICLKDGHNDHLPATMQQLKTIASKKD